MFVIYTLIYRYGDEVNLIILKEECFRKSDLDFTKKYKLLENEYTDMKLGSTSLKMRWFMGLLV